MNQSRVTQLSLEEKAGLVSGDSFWKTRPIEHAGIAAVTLTDGPHGVRSQVDDADHLGLLTSRPATAFPTASATGSSWDPELLEEMGAALGREARMLGADILLGPGVNIKRSPLCGRNFEYFSEDPFLSGALGAGWVHGVQSQGVGASLKHFAANNQETDRQRIDVVVDERTLRELYLPAFEHIIKRARPATVMCSYNKLNGTYTSQNAWLLTKVLRDEWNFNGYVVSDWGAVVDRVAALTAGLDLEMPSPGDLGPASIVSAVKSGALAEGVLDRAVSRIVVGNERIRASRDVVAADVDAHHQLARRLSAESSVLLVNEGQILPLDPGAGGPIAVIGEFARTPRYQGGGSSRVVPTRVDDALTALTAATNRKVIFAPGFGLEGKQNPDAATAAVTAARQAETVLLFLGLPEREESEGFDRSHINLPAEQLALLERLLEVTDQIVVILSNGSVVSLAGIAGRVPAILETWLPGQAGGSAVADMLFGAREPGGRLAETIPICLTDTPAHVNWPGSKSVVHYGERFYVGYRWYDAVAREVAFPFGHGLGYTRFEYTDLAVSVGDPTVAAATVEVSIRNIGDRVGADVVQVYVSDLAATVDRPVRELKGFKKVRLAAGESARVRIELDERTFAFWHDQRWVVEPGGFEISVGASSRDIRLRSHIELNLPSVASLDPDSTLGEWLEDRVGRQLVTATLEAQGPEAQNVLSDDMLPLVSSMPLRSIFGFTGQDGPLIVQQVLSEWKQRLSHLATIAGEQDR